MQSNFGLIDRSYPSDGDLSTGTLLWQRFEHHVQQLGKDAPSGTSYKVLFLTRHEAAFHNAAEAFYGTPAWNVSSLR
jgi:hypothetical protein